VEKEVLAGQPPFSQEDFIPYVERENAEIFINTVMEQK
jgi:hypothetical protein